MSALKPVPIPKRPADLPGKRTAAARVLQNCCPYCGAHDLDGGAVTIESQSAYQTLACAACSREHTRWYDLAAVTYYAPGAGQWTDQVTS